MSLEPASSPDEFVKHLIAIKGVHVENTKGPIRARTPTPQIPRRTLNHVAKGLTQHFGSGLYQLLATITTAFNFYKAGFSP